MSHMSFFPDIRNNNHEWSLIVLLVLCKYWNWYFLKAISVKSTMMKVFWGICLHIQGDWKYFNNSLMDLSPDSRTVKIFSSKVFPATLQWMWWRPHKAPYNILYRIAKWRESIWIYYFSTYKCIMNSLGKSELK